jgi:SAM-dependent methyltransferase
MHTHATDPKHLTTVAYASGANLAARQSIYRFQQPQLHFVDWALAQLEWAGVASVVDVGCGNGAYLRRLAPRVPRLVGLDLSRGMLADVAQGWDEGAPLHLAVADAQALALRDQCADVVLTMHMLYHVPDIPAAVRELRRVLRHGGVLLAATNGERHVREIFDLLSAAIQALGGRAPVLEERSFIRFAAENGAPLLRGAFDQVEWREAMSTLVVPEAKPVIDYLDSMRGWVEPALPAGATWELCMAEVERIVNARIVAEGTFRVATVAGVFVCR